MGGELEQEWETDPEKPCILIGTQDMLLSRALNRGYSIKESNPTQLLILHSRFRAGDRQSTLLKMNSQLPVEGRILVSTQVIEAGVDISARTLITELAPWSSMVQRFGRCNRAGEFGESAPARVICVGPAKPEPYEQQELDDARQQLNSVTDVGISHLKDLGPGTVQPASHVLRRKDLIELFDTTPDLCGADLDVSKFIREKDTSDSQVFWRRFEDERPVPSEPVSGRRHSRRRAGSRSMEVGDIPPQVAIR